MAESADAADSKSAARKGVGVRIPPPAPSDHTPQQVMSPDESGPLQAVRIEKLVVGGDGLARVEGQVVFVPTVASGELVEIRLFEQRSHYARARLERILEPSPDRRTPPCPVFPQCGGCDWLHLTDIAQQTAKQSILEEALVTVRFPAACLHPLIAAPTTLWYRNKLSFSVGSRQGTPVCGFHERASPVRLVSASNCVLQSEVSQEIVCTVERVLEEVGGDRRRWPSRVTVREGRRTGERLIALRWERRTPSFLESWADRLADFATTAVAIGPPPLGSSILLGNGRLKERLGEFEFEIGPDEFFQTNTEQADRMMEWIAARVSQQRPSSILELYAGCGAITLFLARSAQSVTAVEANRNAVVAAARNARHNHVDNIQWICADAERFICELGPHALPDVVVADPPRAGLPTRLRSLLAHGRSHTLVLVSCHLPTLIRDLRALITSGWRVVELQPFDMFPQTSHVEVVVLLERPS